MELEIESWLLALIYGHFLKRKGNREDDLKYVCLDCASKSLTTREKTRDHNTHLVLEPFKCSEYYGYKIEEINGEKLKENGYKLDTSRLAPFSINSNLVYFPMSRVIGGYDSYKKKDDVLGCYCFTCGWKLPNGYSFCSMLCQLLYDFREYPQVLSFLVESLRMHEKIEALEGLGSPKKRKKNKDEKSSSVSLKLKSPSSLSSSSSLVHKRDGLSLKIKLGGYGGGLQKEETKGNETVNESVPMEEKKFGVNGGGIKKAESDYKDEKKLVGDETIIQSRMILKQNRICVPRISGLKRMAMEDEAKERKKLRKERQNEKKLLKEQHHEKKKKQAEESSDKKLQSLVSVVVNEGNMRRRRKGIPVRAPFY